MDTIMDGEEETINIQIFVPELQVRKCLTVGLDDFVWDVKRKLLATLPQALPQAFNYGLFLPPCDGRAGKFLFEDRIVRDYPFHDCVPYLELKYKKRVYKMLNLDEKQLKSIHSKSTLKKFMDHVQSKNAEKVEKLCAQGLDANFHDAQGETPLTLAAGIPSNRAVLVALVGGGAHIDFRNSEGQTAMHKAAFLSSYDNVKTLLELGASPNYRDPIGLTPLYYNMLTTDSNDQVAEMLLREAADLGVTDMHGNHEIHQACKNGLAKHVEHLLFYGAVVDAENVNGNTPLHVCSVNNRPECARVLLFRGADHLSVNKQGQTALHVAHIVGTTAVADIISTHNPSNIVPYRGTPQYSTRRRLSSTLSKRRSLSQTSLCSQDIYGTPKEQRRKPPSIAPSPTPSRISRSAASSDYGTMRRFTPEMAPGHEANIPRILVIPRGPKGFGFILRGAKHVNSAMNFEPTPLSPALQFFEGVDMSGMAMRAGLRPGDYLLEIDGIDVRSASHEQVVHLIQQAGSTITLKVITVDPSLPMNGGTASIRPRSVGSIFVMPPVPPNRHLSTTPSIRGSESLYGLTGEADQYYSPGQLRSTYGEIRCASVKQRYGAGRRISAAELENLMIRQGERQNYQPMVYDQDSISTQTPKKYNSVSDMKRRKQRAVPSPQGLQRSYDYQSCQPINSIYGSPMKTYSSSPDIPHLASFDSAEEESLSNASNSDDRVGNVQHSQSEYFLSESDYSRPFRNIFRPKTPPPPPPPPPSQLNTLQSSRLISSYDTGDAQKTAGEQNSSLVVVPDSLDTPCSPAHLSQSSHSGAGKIIAPPPPPPPPPNLLNASSTSTTSMGITKAGISVEAIRSVALKKREGEEKKQKTTAGLIASGPPDFHADLKNALAKRRSKVALDQDDDEKSDVESLFGGLSLRESVRENVHTKDPKQHSPPGIANKKDSGYTSSRTSLEPSEYGEDRGDRLHFPIDGSSTTRHNVSLISQSIEDNYGARKNIDNMSVSSTLSTLSGCSAESRPTTVPVVPPVDYDDPDSGTGGSDCDVQNPECGAFESKVLLKWTCADAVQWLLSLGLDEYVSAFRARRVDGRALSKCDRVAFTQLGVTRIAHRQKMEASLRQYMGNA